MIAGADALHMSMATYICAPNIAVPSFSNVLYENSQNIPLFDLVP